MTVSLACIKAMEERLDQDDMPRAAVVAGHSLGEYTAPSLRWRFGRLRNRMVG